MRALLVGLTALWACPALAQDGPPGEDAPEELPIVEMPGILEHVEAAWPPGAKEQGLEAVVRMRIELDAEGEVANVEVVEPQGHGFDEAAVDAVLAMRFSPARTAEGPVPVVFEFAYGFRFEEEAPPPEQEAPKPVNLEGRVRQMGTRTALAGVSVVVDGTELVATTDADGRFELRGVPLGQVTVRLLEIDHVTDERTVEMVEGEVTILDLWLRSNTYRDNEIVGVYERKKEEVTRRTITIDEVKRIPGTFGDPIKVVQTLPGAARSPFGTGLLVIRGSNPEDSGVYVDGVRLPIIYHLTGTTSVISPDLIASVDYLPGGYGVQYGRSMGGVVDVKTKREFSEQGKLVWGTDILDSQIYYEGQLGKDGRPKHQIAVAARRSYIDAFIPLFMGDAGFRIRPRYHDYQLKYIAPLPKGQHLSGFFYGFEDVLRVQTPDDFAQGTDQDTQGDLETRYASQRLVVTYEHVLSDTATLELIPSLGVDTANFGLGEEFKLQNANVVGQLRAELRYRPVPELEIVPGIDFVGGAWRFDFKSAVNFEAIDDPLAEREPVGFDGRGTLWSPDVFLKANVRPLGDDRLLLTPGVRGQIYTITQGGGVAGAEPVKPLTNTSLDPRILGRFEVVKGNTLKAATGLYHQPPQPQEAVGLGGQSTVGYERAWASSVGFEQQVSPSITWDVDLFYKRFDDLIVLNPAWTGFGTDPFVNQGDGKAYGMELMARHNPTGRFFGWVSYTLSRAERRDGPDDEVYLFDFDQTHIFSAQAGYDLPHDFSVSAQAQYVTGNPDSPSNAGIYDADGGFYNGFATGPRNSTRLPAFFQTSLRFDRLWTFKRWQLDTYVDLLNTVRGVNPEFRIYNYDYSDSAFVRGLPFIPNLGVEAKFWL